jgi:hypothetical protein
MTKTNHIQNRVAFITAVGSQEQALGVRMLEDSIRTFTGRFQNCALRIYSSEDTGNKWLAAISENTEIKPRQIPEALRDVWFAGKVSACAQAEMDAGPDVERLVWVSPDTLFFQPPEEFSPDPGFDVSVRPVHISNVGVKADRPPDPFWEGVYKAAGEKEITQTVESFVDRQILRPYFNSHLVVADPRKGIFQRWLELFAALAADEEYQKSACSDVPHKVFLHQAALSVLLARNMEEGRLKILPPTYSYPYNLHSQVPPDRKARSLNHLVCAAVEERDLDPDKIVDIELDQTLREWLQKYVEKKM